MVARDIMTKEVITVKPGASVKELAKLLHKHKISGAPVVDPKGQIVGIVSEADILARKGRQVKSIMSTKVIGITEETPVEEIAAIMTNHKVKRLPVLRGEKIVGVVSRADIVSAIARGKHFALNTPIYDL
jgi:tRNA nucleotidyltransferase (CCA-adding enzyme)